MDAQAVHLTLYLLKTPSSVQRQHVHIEDSVPVGGEFSIVSRKDA
jgi:hypothetical protein